MKHLATLLTMAITFTGLGQQMPYNPDANGDDFVGVDDVLGVLGVYDTALMQPDLTCDYEGTDLETAIVGLITEEFVLDSVYVEYLLLDTLRYFTPGCPDEIVEPVVLERSYTCTILFNAFSGPSPYTGAESYHFGFNRQFKVQYFESINGFELTLYDSEVGNLPNHQNTSLWDDLSSSEIMAALTLPLPEEWELNEDGLQVDWRASTWVSKAEYFRLIPFWHEAE